jgi:nitroimidazol reductase NimA-like FMN-containing flavoprotein (pyridoxamine 5'-phosphate oxidase superfamily)
MPSRRDQIKLTDEEQSELIENERIVVISSLGSRGWPHVMPLWYVPRDGEIWVWTYAKSQKVKNLERDPRATLQVETGDAYDQLRGLMLRTEAVLHRDEATVLGFVEELAARYAPPGADPAAMREGFARQVTKRVAIEFAEVGRVSWDHRKLGGTY